jgi:energy-converting hydrogenase Eha subunit A
MPLAAIIVIAVVAALVLAIVLAYALGYAPGDRMRPLRASAAEATDRTSDLAAEFFEWLRTGR